MASFMVGKGLNEWSVYVDAGRIVQNELNRFGEDDLSMYVEPVLLQQ